MTLAELRTEVRRRLDDIAEPHFWSDEQIGLLLNIAQDRACQAGRLLPVEVTLAVALNAEEVSIPVHVFKIDEARISGRTEPMFLIARDQIDFMRPLWRDWDPGLPDYAVINHDGRTLRLAPGSNVAATLTLMGYAIPKESQRMTQDGDAPIIRETDHLPLVHYVCAELLQSRDADRGSLELSEYHRSRFEAHFGPVPTADQLRVRQRERGRNVRPVWM